MPRYFFRAANILIVAALIAGCADSRAQDEEMTVYMSPTCGCCETWIDYVEENDFKTRTVLREDTWTIKEQAGVPPALASCHTAVVDGYVVEGHVPVEAIRKLLDERPSIVGISVSGMPVGAPGMTADEPEQYDVIAFDADGETYVFSSY